MKAVQGNRCLTPSGQLRRRPTTACGAADAVKPGTRHKRRVPQRLPGSPSSCHREPPVRVKWINDLKDTNGKYLSYNCCHSTIPCIGPTRTGASGMYCRDTSILGWLWLGNPDHYAGAIPRPPSRLTAERTRLPSSLVVPESWNHQHWPARQLVRFYSKDGNTYGNCGHAIAIPTSGSRTAIWFHDHALGMTRLNVYAGPAGFYYPGAACEAVWTLELPAGLHWTGAAGWRSSRSTSLLR